MTNTGRGDPPSAGPHIKKPRRKLDYGRFVDGGCQMTDINSPVAAKSLRTIDRAPSNCVTRRTIGGLSIVCNALGFRFFFFLRFFVEHLLATRIVNYRIFLTSCSGQFVYQRWNVRLLLTA